MSSTDKLVRDLLRNEYGQLNATQRLKEQVMELYSNKSVLESIGKAALGVQTNWIKEMGQLAAAAQYSFINNYKASSGIAEAIKALTQPPAFYLSASVANLVNLNSYNDISAVIANSLAKNADLGRIAGNSISAVVATLQAEQFKGLASIQQSFAGIAAGMLREAFEHIDERDEEALARFEQLIDEKIATLPHNQVTAESLRTLIFSLLTLLVALGSLGSDLFQVNNSIESSKTQAENHAQVMSALLRIASSTERLLPEQDKNIYYVVERKVDLKLKPHNSSTTVTTLFPNQKTRLVQTNHKWIYIEYFDYLEGVPKYGWANKKYLKKADK